MKVLQINAVYAKSSTGRTTREMHEFFLSHGIDSYVAAPNLSGLTHNSFKIGHIIDYKIHALLTRIFGKQAYFSYFSTKKLIKYISSIDPDIVVLRNLHGNYINLPLLSKFLRNNDIATVLVLHDSWFITGGCTYYIEPNCNKWKHGCGNCPAIKKDRCNWGNDQTSKVLLDRKKFLGGIPRLSIIGVSEWVANDAKESILKGAYKIDCIYNWIDLSTFCPKEKIPLRKKIGLSGDEYIILGVSQAWSYEKGIDIFMDLAGILQDDMKIVLVGKHDSIVNIPKNVVFLPPTNNLTELADLYAMSDVFVNPTIQETFGKTTAEALSCGIPVVAYYGTATPELVGTDEKCGFLIKSRDSRDYADKILEIRHSISIDYSKNCRIRAEKLFCMESNISQYVSLFNDLIQINANK